MKAPEATKIAKRMSFAAGMNQRFHQATDARWDWWDRAAKITVGVLATTGAMLTGAEFARSTFSWLGFFSISVAVITAIAGVFLSVVPFGELSKRHRDLFARWSDLRQDADTALLRIGNDDRDLDPLLAEWIEDLQEKKNAINAMEPAPDKSLLDACWGDENEARFGYRSPEAKEAGEKAKQLVTGAAAGAISS